jgi:hypothetical protein
MTETEWLERTDDPLHMLHYLPREASERKLRLFACACARRLWDLLTDAASREAVEVAERYADGQANGGDLEATTQAVRRVIEEARGDATEEELDATAFEWLPASVAYAAVWINGFGAAHYAGEKSKNLWYSLREMAADFRNDPQHGASYALQAKVAERVNTREQTDLLREIFGNPFRVVLADPSWLTWNGGTPLRLAQSAYYERALPEGTLNNARLAVLADALEESGCTVIEILTHLRGPGPHVRGCWVIDLLLGKE